MKIAFFVPYMPTRIRTRPFHFLKTLAKNGHQVTLFTVWTTQSELEAQRELESNNIRVVADKLTRARSLFNSVLGLTGAMPLQAVYAWQPALAQTWTRAVRQENFDVIHIEHLRGARYGLTLQHPSAPFAPPIVWDSVDCISALFERASKNTTQLKNRLITRFELPRTRVWEAKFMNAFDETLIVSEAERGAMLALAPNASALAERVHVISNGVDTDYFTRTNDAFEPATLVFSGKMSYHANVTAARFLLDEIMPLVWAHKPDVRVLVVGADPPPVLLKYHDANRVVVTGTVPDVRPFLERATLAVAPIVYGAGVQNKVLEAMAMRTPVVASPSAVAALEVVSGSDVLVAKDASAFAQSIFDLLDAPEHREELAQRGRAYVELRASWQANVAKLENIYQIARTSTHSSGRI